MFSHRRKNSLSRKWRMSQTSLQPAFFIPPKTGHCGRTTSHFAAAGCDSGGEPRSRDAQQRCPRAIRQKPECEAQLHIYDYLSASTMQGLFGLDACPCCSEINVPIDFEAVAAI